MLGGGTDGVAGFSPHAEVLAEEWSVLRVPALRASVKQLPTGYSIKAESAALRRGLDRHKHNGPVDLVGHSFGALVALDFALDHPERVRTLVLAEPPAFWAVPPEERRSDPQMRAMDELLAQLGPDAEPTDEQLTRFLTLLGRTDGKPAGPEQQEAKEWAQKRAALRGLKVVADHNDDLRRLKAFGKPVLVVTGKDTVAFHRRIDDVLAASFPSAKRAEIPGGHRAAVTAKDKFVATLKAFLKRHE
jgi:pimeloyl-ACP methyl ester carboxylesterase